jgi:hypothetical protein
VSVWQEIIFGWVVVFTGPKLIVIPVWRWMWKSMKETERLDALDRAWLAEHGYGNGDGLDPATVRWQPARPRRSGGPGRIRRTARRYSRSRT